MFSSKRFCTMCFRKLLRNPIKFTKRHDSRQYEIFCFYYLKVRSDKRICSCAVSISSYRSSDLFCFRFQVHSYKYFFCVIKRIFLERTFRSSRPEVFCKKSVFRKFTGKHLRQSRFFNKVAGLRPVTLLKKRLWHKCFPVNFAKFLRILFLQNTSGRLLLNV